MKKEITYSIYVSVDGEFQNWSALSQEQRQQISIELNDRAVQSIGYRKNRENRLGGRTGE